MLRKRVITALWILPLLAVTVWFDEPLPWFTVLVAVWGLLAVFEFYRLVAVSRILTLTCFGLLWTLLFILSPHCDYQFIVPLLLTSAIVLSLVWLVLRPQKEGAFLGWAWTMAGILYVGWLLSYLVALRLDAGINWVFFALLTTFGSDTLAFFVGRALGRHHLAPRISPHKTWEGAIAGVFGAIIVSLLFTLPTPLSLPLSYGQAVILGLLVSVFGQLGDLAESLLKRSVGVKESGKLVSGHGGFLDRMDSVVFAGVVVYLYYIFAIL
ncbi:phosphatidate cytidylyltransferase [Chloroflexota bacterium]